MFLFWSWLMLTAQHHRIIVGRPPGMRELGGIGGRWLEEEEVKKKLYLPLYSFSSGPGTPKAKRRGNGKEKHSWSRNLLRKILLLSHCKIIIMLLLSQARERSSVPCERRWNIFLSVRVYITLAHWHMYQYAKSFQLTLVTFSEQKSF